MSNSLPKVSVVCAWYNRAQYIVESINSILNQDYNNLEIIIVNDGSPDEKVVSILDRFSSDKVKVIHQDNQGFTKAITNAIAHSSGDLIAIHGAGDISYPTRISKLVERISLDENSVAVGSGTVQCPAGYSFRKRYFQPRSSCNSISLSKNMPFVHGTVMFDRAAYEKVGGYDSRFKYCADWDLFFKLVSIGNIVSVNEFLYEQKIFSDGFSFSPEHKFKQIWFRERAVNRCEDSRNMLDESEKFLVNINSSDPIYFQYSLNFFMKSLFKFDFRNSLEWFRLMVLQVKNKSKKY
ncbi:glycosyltransferase family 2 protein [Vibrio cyclitrophicus]|uniref:glycosyltransferase family 2 protein n=1 Tax=Vibrio cyclitrophicus TaxID=47951 RepID=UPI000C83515E|nr:glycosyltransferase [Vibrio cyclitrophicus]PMG35129.1 hypothetical protein BCU92_21435 [Vibrio cyclitrophicus]